MTTDLSRTPAGPERTPPAGSAPVPPVPVPGAAPAPGPAPAPGRGAAVLATAGATFTVVTSEMLPVGLLSPMAAGLGVSEGAVGLTVTLPGLIAAVTSLLLPTLAGRADRRTLLCGLLLVLAAANALSALAPGFGVLLAARLLVGVCVGGVWALAAGVTHRLVPPEGAGRAIAVVFSGIAIASVLGVPGGALIGELAGWRWAFAAAAVLALTVAVLLAVLLPPLPAGRTVRPREVVALLARPSVRSGLAVVVALVTGHFAAYTYVRPALERVDGVASGAIGGLLLLYGVAGIAGNFLGGAQAARSPRRTLLVVSAALAVLPALLAGTAALLWLSVALLVGWGLAYGAVSVSATNWMQAAVPDAREAASGLFSGFFNLAIAVGAGVGGMAVEGFGEAGALLLGAGLAALALVLVTAAREPGTTG
ncbi:MFS transporter [Streptomyces sp. NPDC000594]|uniref:MFS transporter n=1 Tax=Streptomyces sp. NPDC000594 TaxID=3154261 RepID=UPI003329F82A